MKKIILNVDDLGISRGVNEATKILFDHGIVKSATAMMNMPYYDEIDKELLGEDFSLGIHFVLSMGKPLTNGFKHIINPDGTFKKLFNGHFGSEVEKESSEAIENELRAQLEKFVATYGQNPTHIDSHHHAHRISNVSPIIEAIASEINVKIRGLENNEKPNGLYHLFNQDNYKIDNYEDFLAVLNNVEDRCEIMVHVSTVNDLETITSYASERLVEFNLMLENEADLKSKFEFISYRDL